jgi:nucleoid DNA-binding protein
MELEIYNAFIKAGVTEADAKAVVESINKEIDKRYSLHATQLFAKADGASLKAEIAQTKSDLIKAIAESQRWTITAVFAAVGLFAALSKVLH